MPIVLTGGSLQSITAAIAPPLTTASGSSWTLGYDVDPQTYILLYRTQPNVRTVVDFLARNIAQLDLHVYRRLSDTDRERLIDHDTARWLQHPTDACTRYRLIESLMIDLGIFLNAFWYKMRQFDGRTGALTRIAFQRLPPEQMRVEGGLVPGRYIWTTAHGDTYTIPPADVVHFAGHNPLSPLTGLAPLETLRRVLAEDIAAINNREAFWRNASRIEGVVERPLAAKVWSPEQVESYRSQWSARFGGAAGVGAVPVLQEGMTFKPISFSPRQAEYVQARKLTREEVASAYHVPLPMVGILDHATFSNIREQHKQLYQDSLGPWLEMIVGEIDRQILPESSDPDRVYYEFNIAAKLSGSFEEQAGSLQSLVGRPIMTANEGRARLNLPALDEPGADQLVRPLNTAPEGKAPPLPSPQPTPDEDAIDVEPVIEQAWQRQQAALAKIDAPLRALTFDAERWTRELAADLVPVYRRAGVPEAIAEKRAAQLAQIVNTDTRALLTMGVPAFTQREASRYVA